MQYLDHVEAALKAASLSELKAISQKNTQMHGLNHHGYAVALSNRQAGHDSFHMFNDFGGEWGDSYKTLANPHVAASDVRVMHVRAGMPTTAWNVKGDILITDAATGKVAGSFLRRAGEYGISAGITVPICTPGVNWAFMTFTTDSTTDLRDLLPSIAPMAYFASCLHVAMRRLQGWEETGPKLTGRQKEVLTWAAVGKSSWDISVLLGISERTVNFHLEQCAVKLCVRGRRATCARAISLGLITI